MKIRTWMLLCAGVLVACTKPVAPPDIKKLGEEIPKKPEEKKPVTAATNLNTYKRELALRISQMNAGKVYGERPQALLRSVIVLKFFLNGDGKLLHSEIMRSNHDKGTEATALASISKAAPFARPPAHLLRNGRLEIIETWLFNNDGRFQLRTIALPQMDE